MYNRFYAFGCSWTKHVWPTWADIIAYDLNIPYENWGMSGSGNSAIQSRIHECDLQNSFTKKDLIIVCWSSWTREDRYINKWLSGGNIFNNSYYDESFIKKYWSWENDVIKNSTIINLTNKAYDGLIAYQMSMLPKPELQNNSETIPWIKKFISNNTATVEDVFLKNLEMPDTFNKLNLHNSKFNGTSIDDHPDIMCHLSTVKEQIYPAIGLSLKQSTIDKFTSLSNEISSVLSLEDTYDSLVKKVHSVLKNNGTNLPQHIKHYGF